jgi:hypothetical protein
MPNRASPESHLEKKERLAVEGAAAMKEYIANAEAVNDRTARLRAERLAREAEAAQARREAVEARSKVARKRRAS